MRMRELWKQRGLLGEIFSMTPILLSTSFQNAMNGEMMGMPLREAKALEINAWFYQNAGKDYQYVILDDENYFFLRLEFKLLTKVVNVEFVYTSESEKVWCLT